MAWPFRTAGAPSGPGTDPLRLPANRPPTAPLKGRPAADSLDGGGTATSGADGRHRCSWLRAFPAPTAELGKIMAVAAAQR